MSNNVMQEIIELQKKFSNLIGISGYEDDVRKLIVELVTPLVDEIKVDPLGNVLAIKKGTNPDAHRILFDAHMDEVGFMVSHIEDNGYLRFNLVGSFDTRILLAQAVVIRSNNGKVYHGIIGAKPPHILSPEERKKNIAIDEMYIDVAMNSAKEVEENGITLGTTGTLHDEIVLMPNNYLRARAIDDRIGCNIIIQLLKKLQDMQLEETILASFTVQEEVGLRGAGPAAYTLKPTIAIAVETTTAANVPNVRKQDRPTETGLGPSITIKDSSSIAHPRVNERLIKNADLKNIKYQIKRPVSKGGNNAGKIHLTRGGIPSSIISVPTKYLHSSISTANMEDAYNALLVLEAFLENKAKVEVYYD